MEACNSYGYNNKYKNKNKNKWHLKVCLLNMISKPRGIAEKILNYIIA